ncbi:MAG: transglutaminase domain-containing protein [Gramella sp.]|nr:transglutaminase domain-containing protein [Christiangramia sp.]
MSITFKEDKLLNSHLQYTGTSNNPALKELRETYQLDKLIDPEKSDFDNIINVQSWIYTRWEHASGHFARKKDALYILEQARKGKRFSCAEYSTVGKACLQALGFTVRKTYLRPEDTKSAEKKTGHVLNEVYLKDLKKWFFMDPCFDIIIKKDSIPLNAAELLKAMMQGDELEVINPSNEITCAEYLEKIGPFLSCFSTRIDVTKKNIWRRFYGSKSHLTLLPLEVETPKNIKLRDHILTYSMADFYPEL